MIALIVTLGIVAIVALILLGNSIRIVKQYEMGVVFRFGRLTRTR
ncbi:MAG: hypothetical protein JWP70_2153, partial [Leifsonia sp.]|nr:hypothetical protein [Leifsonia sp.]